MAQKKQAGKKNKKSARKKSSSQPVSQTARKAAKAGVKKKVAGSNKKKQAPTGRKSSVKKPSPAKIKSAKIKKTPKKRIEKKKTVTKSSVKPGKVTGTPGKAIASARPSLLELTATERYSAGGLFACAIERTSDPDFKRLRSVLRELDLPSLEKDNLIRLSEGFTIPKLFADSIAPHKAGSLVEGLVKFAVGDGGYERKWKNDIRQVAVWLGLEGPAVEAIERRAASQ